ncbi:cleavage stimulation factor subunit 3 [Pancytospora epiphaga]|nr:cleavage stimulation factor subunit 3 [Pancytospora epiphaga]
MGGDTVAKNYESQDSLYKHGMDLYNNKNNKELEILFQKFLRNSYDLRFWRLYIEYVKRVSVRKAKIIDVYKFVLDHFKYSYFMADLIQEYIMELSNNKDEIVKDEEIRKKYQKVFGTPMDKLTQLWGEYEKWEYSVNKGAARGFIEQSQAIYTHTNAVYQKMLPFIQTDNYFKILDIELENPLKLTKVELSSRLSFVFNFYISKFPTAEGLYFLRSFYLEESMKDEKPRTLFLSIWYSFLYKNNLFDFSDTERFDLVCINHFNWLIKNSGLEAFRTRFQDVKERVGPHVYIYVANAEYYQGGSKEQAYQVFQEIFTKDPEDSLVCEEFFKLFIKIGDDENIRSLFKKLGKTEKMWEMMIEHEYLYGDIVEYKGLVMMQQEAIKRKEVLPPAPVAIRKDRAEGTKDVYETVKRSFGYLNLQLSNSSVIETFLEKLPKLNEVENIFANISTEAIVELLLSI